MQTIVGNSDLFPKNEQEKSRADAERDVFVMPATPLRTALHIILEVHDAGTPSLTSYRRVIVSAGAVATQ